jgi:ubiquinol-cytochrome c reductase cytochrome b subunit
MLHWLNDRTGLRDAWRRWADAPIGGGAGWGKALPAAILFVFCVQVVTGLVLWMYYCPGTSSAWESVYYLQTGVAGGWLLRAVHHYAGQVLLVLAGLYLLKLIFTGAYRAPREAVYWVAILLFLCAFGLLLTGDLLGWSQNGYAATKTRVGFLRLLPGVGDDLFRLAAGETEFGNLTLTRFTAFHIGLCGGGFLLLLILHGIFTRRANERLPSPIGRGPQRVPGGEGIGGEIPKNLKSHQKTPLTLTLSQRERGITSRWPGQAWRSAAACLLVLAVVLGLSFWLDGPELGSPADRANEFADARPEWALRGLYQFVHYFPGQWTVVGVFVVPGVVLLLYVLMPFTGKWRGDHFFNLLLTVCLLGAAAGLSYLSYARDAQDQSYQNAVAEETRAAERVVELAEAKGIPPSGALTLLHDDPLTQGRRVFKQNCAACHAGAGVPAVEATAPNLAGFGTRERIAGLLNPKTVGSTDYFGYKGSPFKGGRMVGHVKDTLADLDEEEQANLKKVVMALSAEARLPAQKEIDARDGRDIEKGRKLILSGEFGCTVCHRFHGKGERIGPELTGYGSKEWIAAISGNPASKRFYGKRNDRMPAYAETDDETKNLLRNHDLDMTAKWLRGEWYRPKADR